MKHITTFLLSFLLSFLFGQESRGGFPYTIEKNIEASSNIIDMNAINIERLLTEDENRPPATPFRYGYKFDVNLSLENSGEWTIVPKPNILLVFPAWVWHKVLMNKEDTDRISLSFNTIFVQSNG